MTDELEKRVAAIPFWYHHIELPGGIITPGCMPISAEAYRLPEDLTGRRVLDVGAWDGYWTFEALKRGASQVVAIDDFSDVDNFLPAHKDQHWVTYDLCREALGYTDEQCPRREMSLYKVSSEALGRFDVVLLFGVLYHLRHPLLGLDAISGVCDGELYAESAICDDYSAYQPYGHSGYQRVMEFYPGAEYGKNPTNWWVPSMQCLGAMVGAAGFVNVQMWKLCERPAELAACRGFAFGHKPRRDNENDQTSDAETEEGPEQG